MLIYGQCSEKYPTQKCLNSACYGYCYSCVLNWVCKCQYINHIKFINVVKDMACIYTDTLLSPFPFISLNQMPWAQFPIREGGPTKLDHSSHLEMTQFYKLFGTALHNWISIKEYQKDSQKAQMSFPPLPYRPQEDRKEKGESQHASWSFSCFLTARHGKEKQKGHSVHDCVESQE